MARLWWSKNRRRVTISKSWKTKKWSINLYFMLRGSQQSSVIDCGQSITVNSTSVSANDRGRRWSSSASSRVWKLLLQSDTHTHMFITLRQALGPHIFFSLRSLSTRATHPANTSIFTCQVLKSCSTTAGWNVKRPLGLCMLLMNYKPSSSS